MTAMSPPDNETMVRLVASARQGDGTAMRELVRRSEPHLYGLARRQPAALPAGLRPSDLVQDTLERAVRSLHQFHGRTDGELRGWLAVILRNVLIQKRRAAGRQRRAAELVPLPSSDQLPAPDPPPGPSQTLRGREAWRDLLRAVFALPDDQREAVHRYLRGDTVPEIAAALTRTPAAVSCLLQRGGKALQAALGEHGSLGDWFTVMRALLAGAQ
jgi:RNA polymerase sigma-70 factor (ECF subfamily)